LSTLRAVREFLLVLSDLYVRGEADSVPVLPHLDAIARFGRALALPHGWRAWLTQYVGRSDLQQLPAAAVAATLLARKDGDGAGARPLCFATPVQLRAALTHVRLGSHGVLRLAQAQARTLAADFNALWEGSALALHPLGGQFILEGLPAAQARGCDPALALGADIAPYVAQGADAPALRALGAEIEMWLHGHALNRERVRAGEAPVSALWLWGGGVGPAVRRALPVPAAFSDELFVRGLWQACGADARPLPPRAPPLEDLGERALAVVELFSGAGALAQLEECWLKPLLAALAEGRLQRLRLIANEQLFTLGRAARLKFWRRPRSMLAAQG
jgi:hypothetical protein